MLLEGLDELVDQFQLIELAQASHWLVHEQPDQVAAHIEKFLKD